MTLLQLKYFVGLYENGSTSKTADILHVSQSTLSLSLKDLETELCLSLFRRTSRGLIPSESGEALYRHARNILAAVDACELDMKRLSVQAPPFILGLTTMIGSALWPQLYSRIQKELPELDISTVTGRRTALLELLQNQKIHAILTTIANPSGIPPHLKTARIGQAPPIVFCISRKNPLASLDQFSYEKMCPLPLIALTQTTLRGFVEKAYRSHGFEPKYLQTNGQISVIAEMIRMDFGAGFLNQKIAECYPDIKTYLVNELGRVDYYLIWENSRNMPQNHRNFFQLMKKISLDVCGT